KPGFFSELIVKGGSDANPIAARETIMRPIHRCSVISLIGVLCCLVAIGCRPAVEPSSTLLPPPEISMNPTRTPPDSSPTPRPTDMPVPFRLPVDAAPAAGFTYLRADGNRLVSGQGHLPRTLPLDIPLAGVPQWIAAAAYDRGVVWAVVLADGRTQAFYVRERVVQPIPIVPDRVENVPPMLLVQRGEARLMIPPTSRHGDTHPVIIDQAEGIWAFTYVDGRLNVMQQREPLPPGTLAVDALPDARILVDERQRLLLLSGPTDRYGHAVLGDNLEAGSITLVDTRPEIGVVRVIDVPAPAVIEGIAPIWADLDGDGQREIIVTQSTDDAGAQVVVYDESGAQVAVGPAVGRGFRWRHQIAVATFGPDGELELVDVLTPHIGGVVTFYQWRGTALQVTAQLAGYTSHVLGTRNLDMAAAGDFDGDGRVELLLPAQDRSSLGAVRRTRDGAETVWVLPLPALLQSNLAAAQGQDGRIVVGAGLADGTLRLWGP
ncbi:MAG: hypothetical protein KC418_13215, partial [Anaerolineales bacterium]|nr:hypothetical protein [Anaerolineales bacterium]